MVTEVELMRRVRGHANVVNFIEAYEDKGASAGVEGAGARMATAQPQPRAVAIARHS